MTAAATAPVDNQAVPDDTDTAESVEERRPLTELFRDLRTSPKGLSERGAARRRLVYGANQVARRGGRRWPRELLDQFTQPLAILLAVAAVLAWVGGTPALSIAVVAVILLNAGFAFVQEMQAERAVEALAAFLPATTKVVRDGLKDCSRPSPWRWPAEYGNSREKAPSSSACPRWRRSDRPL